MTGPVFSLYELVTYLKNTDFHFSNLGKTAGFRSKTLHKHYIYENCKIYFFEIIFTFSFWNKNFQKIGCARARLLLLDCVEVTFHRSSGSQMFFKTGDVENSAIFTRKHLYWSLFLIKLLYSSLLKRDSNTCKYSAIFTRKHPRE